MESARGRSARRYCRLLSLDAGRAELRPVAPSSNPCRGRSELDLDTSRAHLAEAGAGSVDPRLGRCVQPRTAPWLQLELHDKRVLSAWADYPARSVETDDLDLYLRDPQLIVGNTYQPMLGLEGILIPRSSIASVYVVKR
jgi:hypothetical protein